MAQQGIGSAMRAYGFPDREIEDYLSLMRFRQPINPRPGKRQCHYGEKLRSGEKVKVVIEGFLVPGTVVESWRVATVLKLEKSGEVKWVLGEADLSLG